jgi:fused signal recognition particle receptor
MFNWFGGKSKDKKPSTPNTPASVIEPAPASNAITSKLKEAVSSTSKALVGQLMSVFNSDSLSDEQIDDIEELLIRADVGLPTATAVSEKIRKNKGSLQNPEQLKAFLKTEFTTLLSPFDGANRLGFFPGKLNIYLVVGVNGAGKTTFIGKLAHRFKRNGLKVLIGAGDTFRAAAEEQLDVWAQRAGAEIVIKEGADSAAVMHDTLTHAKTIGADVVLLDTAGRLQNKFNLMEELRKIYKVIQKERPEDSHFESLLVLDATTGQNALKQAEIFKEAVDLSGVILTKLDGSAKGGVILTIAQEYQLPVKMVGIGEGIEDLKDFNNLEFIDALFEK